MLRDIVTNDVMWARVWCVTRVKDVTEVRENCCIIAPCPSGVISSPVTSERSDHWWVMTRCGPRDPWLWLSDPASANNIPNIKVFACSVKTQITYTWGQGVFLFENYQEVLEVLICSLAWHFVTLESLDTRKIISIENVLSYYLLLV